MQTFSILGQVNNNSGLTHPTLLSQQMIFAIENKRKSMP